ncbi:MAG: anaerobic ribonucleoside-triphosphate reductase [Bacilli bacterium]|nr:anaerobic ribonucleoside-triphosphate reductase [Bacilli bacterium]
MEDIFNNIVVVKRSGQRVSFNGLKIVLALKKAFDSVPNAYTEKDINKVYENVLNFIIENYKERKTINVEDIQDIIEDNLNRSKYKQVFEEFSKYRKNRAESRKAFSIKQQHKFVKSLEKIDCLNLSNSTPDQMLYSYGSVISLEYLKAYLMDNKYVKAHEEGRIFIHQLSYFNLGYIGPTHLKLDGYVNYDINELIYILIQAKKEINGEIAIDSIDGLLSDFVLEKFKTMLFAKTKKYLEINDYIGYVNLKKLEDKLNNLVNIEFNNYEDVFLNKKTIDLFRLAYDDTLKEIEVLLKTLFDTMLNILNKEGNYSISFGVSSTVQCCLVRDTLLDNLKNNKYDNIKFIYKLVNSTDAFLNDISKVIINNNVKLSLNNKRCVEYFSTGLRMSDSEIVTGKSNIANVSINMSRLGIKYPKLKDFYKALDETLEVSKNILEFMFETIGDKKKDNYKILFDNNIFDDEKLEYGQTIRKVIKNGTLNINLVGLKECCISLNSDNYNSLVLKILKYIRTRVDLMNSKTKLNFTLSSINYPDVSSYLIDIDKTAYGLINKVTKKEIYENISLITNINQIQRVTNYQKILNGGNVLEMILPSDITIDKVSKIIRELEKEDINFAYLKVGEL